MKRTAFLLCCFSLWFSYGQQDDGANGTPPNNYASEIDNMIQFPKSPEAFAFEQYGNTAVNMYTGQPDIQIPLGNVQGKELSVPFSLSYDASGIKVSQVATTAGLGWNLVAGGRITAMVNGHADGSSSYTPADANFRAQLKNYCLNRVAFDSEAAIDNYADFIYYALKNRYDTQLDLYSLNAIGINDYIVFDIDTYTPKALLNPRLEVSAGFSGSGISQWTVTSEDGTKYYFESDGIETTHVLNDDADATYVTSQNYNSSWVLTKIESKNGRDVFEFDYNTYTWDKTFGLSSPSSRSYRINPLTNVLDAQFNVNYSTTLSYKNTQKALQRVVYNGTEMVVINYKDRDDIIFASGSTSGNALDTIIFKDGSAANQVLQTVTFEHADANNYFGSNNYDNTTELLSVNYYKKRLKLDKIRIGTGIAADDKTYSFDYFSPEYVPTLVSYSQDYLGLYNGAGNTSLIPGYSSETVNIPGAVRSPNFNTSIYGTLQRITYPTGGYTDFEFEQNQVYVGESSTTNTVSYGSCSVNSATGGGYSLVHSLVRDMGSGDVSVCTNLFYLPQGGNYTVDYGGANGIVFINTADLECTQWSDPITPPDGGAAFQECLNSEITPVDTATLSPIAGGHAFVHSGTDYDGGPIYLSGGYYQVTLVNTDDTVLGTNLSFSLTGQVTTDNSVNKSVAGFRVKSITNYTEQDAIATRKNYQYTMGLQSGISSGKMQVSDSKYTTVRTSRREENLGNAMITGQECDVRDVTTITLNATGVNVGNQPHVVYRSVIESENFGDIDPTTGHETLYTNGYKQHNFHTGAAGLIGIQGGNLFIPNFKVGKQHREIAYTRSKDTLYIKNTDYDHINLPNQNSFYETYIGLAMQPFNNFADSKAMVKYKATANNKWYYNYVDAYWISWDGNPCTKNRPTQSDLNDMFPGATNISYLGFLGQHSANVVHLGASGRIGAVVKEDTKTFLEDQTITNTQRYHYDPEANYLLRLKTSTINNGETLKELYQYPFDFETPSDLDPFVPNVYSTMVSDHRLTDVIQMTSYKDDQRLATQRYEYERLGGDLVLPELVQRSKGASPLETRAHFEYYPDGNIKSSYQAAHTDTAGNTTYSNRSTYIWGYNNTRLIARIDNASYDQVSTYVANLQSLSNADNDHCTDTACSEQALRTALNNLRSALPQAMVTTYTYDPLIGVTSITDPRGQTQYFEYDDLHRLKAVRDAQGHLLSENQYHYRPQN